MVEDLSVGQSSTSETEAWRYSGSSVSCKSAHQVFVHAESDRVVPNSYVTLHVAVSSPTQQSTVDHTHQPDIRPGPANPVSARVRNTVLAEEGRFLNASDANTIKLKHYGTRNVEGCTRDVNGTEIPLNIKFNVFDVKSPLLSTNKLRKYGYTVLLDQQQIIQKNNGTTIALIDQNGLQTLELRLASRAGCAPD